MSRISIPADAANPLEYVLMTHGREMGAAGFGFSYAIYEHTQLSLREMEGARMRTAQINGCTVCKGGQAARDFNDSFAGNGASFSRPMDSRGASPDQAFYDAVADWRESPLFSDRERLAIEFAERMGETPQSIPVDDGLWKRLHAAFTDGEIVDLTLSVASWIAMGRFMHVLALDTVCSLNPAATAKAAE